MIEKVVRNITKKSVIFYERDDNVPPDKTNKSVFSNREVSKLCSKAGTKNASRCYLKWSQGGHQDRVSTLNDYSFRRLEGFSINLSSVFILLGFFHLFSYSEGKT